MIGGCGQTGTYSFRCSACGRCCNTPPQMSLPELLRHERLFVGSLAISKVRTPRPGTRLGLGACSSVVSDADGEAFAALADALLYPAGGADPADASDHRFAIAAQAFDYASQPRCPALAEGRCTIHGDEKPATCAVVPLDPLVPDRLQHVVLARRADGTDSVGSHCIARGERDGFAIVTHEARVVEPSFRNALGRRRADLSADKRFWGDRVFEMLKKELFSSPAAIAKLPAGGFLSLSLVPALLVLAAVSDACRERCLEYIDAQLTLIQRRVEQALLRGRREDRSTTDQLRAWSKAYQALAKPLGAAHGQHDPAIAGEAWRSDVETWLGIRGGPSQPLADARTAAGRRRLAPAAERNADVEYTDEIVAQAKQLRITPQALHTYLQAGVGERAPGVNRYMHATIKPGGATCNLECTYCYYLGKQQLLGRGERRMDDALLDAFIVDYIQSQDAAEIAFTWHGGEPTLLGLDFFEKVVSLQAKHTPTGRRVSNDLQTNGTLLSDAWCAFLRESRFLVGLSVDGPRHLHDLYRRTRNGSSSCEAVVAASRRLKRYGVPFGTLTTVNRINATMPLDVYRFLRDEIGSSSMQFIPCVEPNRFEEIAPGHHGEGSLPETGSPTARPGHPHSAVTNWSVDPDDWGRFLCATFDEWATKDVGRVKVNLFETVIAQLNGKPALICTSSPFCGKNVALEHDGRVYSCDHFVYPEHEIGRIGERSLSEIVFSRRQLEFGLAKRNSLSRQCRECAYLNLCWGECPRTRLLRTREGEGNLSYLCRGWKSFFDHALPLLERMGIGAASA